MRNVDDVDGSQMYEWLERLFPICRSITGNGLRQSLLYLQELVPLNMIEVPSGTQVFDWIIPPEWNIRQAWVKDSRGNTIVDFLDHNLHLVNYSRPIHATMSFDELRPHLHSLPEQPDAIPYRTTYYQDDWGFCLSHRQLESMSDSKYEVLIDSTLTQGSMTLGELVIPGESQDEVLFSSHICHPSLANDNLSGVVVAARMAIALMNRPKRKYSYRFLWMPGTIGAIAWLAMREQVLTRIRYGLVLSGLGDSGQFHYKQSRQGNADIDRIVEYILNESGHARNIAPFSPYGYDERQFCSPGINLPVGCFSRSCWGTYPQYHTSHDNTSFVQPDALCDSLYTLIRIIDVIEGDCLPINLYPKCEPQLGKRGLYDQVVGNLDRMAILWLLNQADGSQSLLEIACKSGIAFAKLRESAELLNRNGLLDLQEIEKPNQRHIR